ncbi:FMN-binding protein [Marinifilum caeruleilacunae]|uniref:FMN-binding protein n=1 Tax=Marinifilum caeruleilacunae TaxID=2499076 RepID=A0ABX1WRB4_9BACT|nr:FMN-binding protein [Marinifilum caeruleilacunae]NOU58474.1 FMN-binding protein [Marinifilum caeruleilacunae]
MKKYINWLAYLSLALAYFYGVIYKEDSQQIQSVHAIQDENIRLGKEHNDIYPVYRKDSLMGYLAFGTSQGYGGPLQVAVLTNTTGEILSTELIGNYETPSFVAKLSNKKYYQQYANKKLLDRFQLKQDVEAVSGATVSSLAIAHAARDASYKIAKDVFQLHPPDIEKKWRLTAKEGIIALIILLAFVGIYIKSKKLIYLNLFLGLVFIGFLFNASLSLTHFGRLTLGYFPDIHTHVGWWLLLAATLSIIIVWGKNVYCTAICPFRASQMLLQQVSGINIKMDQKTAKIMGYTPVVLIWLSLILIFISKNPSISSYEPFAMLFSLKGAGIQWYILPTALIGALFFSNFFCRFFCPVGGILNWLIARRNQIKKLLIN